jgi:hypothetical protein
MLLKTTAHYALSAFLDLAIFASSVTDMEKVHLRPIGVGHIVKLQVVPK